MKKNGETITSNKRPQKEKSNDTSNNGDGDRYLKILGIPCLEGISLSMENIGRSKPLPSLYRGNWMTGICRKYRSRQSLHNMKAVMRKKEDAFKNAVIPQGDPSMSSEVKTMHWFALAGSWQET